MVLSTSISCREREFPIPFLYTLISMITIMKDMGRAGACCVLVVKIELLVINLENYVYCLVILLESVV